MRAIIDRTRDQLFDELFAKLNNEFNEGGQDFMQYQDNPVGFAEEVLGETLTDDVKEMMESVRDNQITVAQSANATGKTHAAGRVAIWWYKVFESCQVFTAAAPPENNLKKLLWGEIGSIVENHQEIFDGDEAKSLHVAKGANNFLTGVSIPSSGTAATREAKFSGKHSPNLLFILDEGDAIPDEVYKGIESCMSGGHARLLVMFNPRAEQGEAYRMVRDGRANVVSLSAFNHPNVLTGEDKIPGAVTREVTVRRINQWCRPLVEKEKSDSNCFKLPSFLVGKTAIDQAGRQYSPLSAGWYKITEPAFSYMVLGKYPAQASTALISREWLNNARSRWDSYVAQHGEAPPQGSCAIMGQDVGEFGTDANVSCFRYGGFVERLVAWGGVDTLITANRATDEFKSRNVRFCNVDATGVGSGVSPVMKSNGCRANAVKVAATPTERTELGDFRNLRSQLWWACREWLRLDTGSMLPPDNDLLEELAAPTYEVRNGKVEVMQKQTMRELLKRSPDRADALCLTFYQPELLFPNL
ncbi:hypothetical protein [Desulfogranum marinum]|uniref:hypothetical protein n=1 Tax=Desulfogranum marinum TaxID=453220 RepID=UPI001966C8D6|nr:hypothetical protein [Desulfogranum marinum]MBM9515043.1 hypothetical protein [Desulfogranum marinum]